MRQFINQSKIVRGLMALVFTLGLGVGVASADSPHFIAATAKISSDGTLTCTWKEAGLGTNQLISYVCTADGTAIYACINRGGNHPNATNKETVSGPVSATGDFSSGQNGQVTGSLTISPPDTGGFSCPPGQDLVLASVSYSNIQLVDSTNNINANIAPSAFSACLLSGRLANDPTLCP